MKIALEYYPQTKGRAFVERIVGRILENHQEATKETEHLLMAFHYALPGESYGAVIDELICRHEEAADEARPALERILCNVVEQVIWKEGFTSALARTFQAHGGEEISKPLFDFFHSVFSSLRRGSRKTTYSL